MPRVRRLPGQLPDGAGPAEAARWIRELVRFVGPGFHPDTNFSEYVDWCGKRSFLAEEGSVLADRLAHAWSILDNAGISIYTVAFREQRRLLRCQQLAY